MAVSTKLKILQVSENQAAKATATNMALSMLENALSTMLTVDTSAATVSGFDVVMDFVDDNDLSSRLALRCIVVQLTAGATQPFDLIHPDNPHFFFLINNTSQTCTVKRVSGGATTTVAAGATSAIYCTGFDILKLL